MQQDFLSYLDGELRRRIGDNPHYSLRAFARDLDIEPSLLSKILRKKVPLTEAMFTRISTRLRIPMDICNILKWATFEDALPPRIDEQHIDYLTVEEFCSIRDWYHYAILEMVTLEDFSPDAKWFANRLQLPLDIVTEAIRRLFSLGLLINTHESWKAATEFSSTLKQAATNEALRDRQAQVLQKAVSCVYEVPPEARHNSAITIAFDPKLLPAVQHKISQFRRSLASFIEKESKTKSEVYELAFAFFPLTSRGNSDSEVATADRLPSRLATNASNNSDSN